VVAAGLVVAFPEGGRAPPPGAMVTDETPVIFQFSMEFPPALMLVGLAVNETTTGKVDGGGVGGGGAAAATMTVTCLVTVPAALVAIRV